MELNSEPRSRSLLSFVDDVDSNYSDSDVDDIVSVSRFSLTTNLHLQGYSAEDYLRIKSRDSPLDCSLFAAMETDQQLAVLQNFDE